jgi:hypothetical protein
VPGPVQQLAVGLERDGMRHSYASLQLLDYDCRWRLLDECVAALPAERVTAVLAAGIEAIGDIAPVTTEQIRELTVGDRDRLVLALRRELHGDSLELVFSCRCGERLELVLGLSDLLDGGEPDATPTVTGATSSGTTSSGTRLTVRAATGADHERAARTALTDPEAARARLLADCVVAVDPAGSEDFEVPVRAAALLAEVDPAAEITLAGECPACGATAATTLDPIAILWQELEQRQAALESEVHALALHYHWSEREIVALPPARRARYIAQLAQAAS